MFRHGHCIQWTFSNVPRRSFPVICLNKVYLSTRVSSGLEQEYIYFEISITNLNKHGKIEPLWAKIVTMFFNFAFYLTTSTNLYILFRFIYFIWEFSAIFRNSIKLCYGFWSECSLQFFSSFLTNKLFLYCSFKLCTRKIPQKVVYRNIQRAFKN